MSILSKATDGHVSGALSGGGVLERTPCPLTRTETINPPNEIVVPLLAVSFSRVVAC